MLDLIGETVYVRDGTGYHYFGRLKEYKEGHFIVLAPGSVWVWDFQSYQDFPNFLVNGDFTKIKGIKNTETVVILSAVYITKFNHEVP